jgi:hypothetical protein
MAGATRVPRWRFGWRLQISLRFLLIACAAAGVALGLWFRPFTKETLRPDGSLRTRFELRRDWRGRLTSHGLQTWRQQNGTTYTCRDYGTVMEDDDFSALLVKTGEFNRFIWLITETIIPETWSSTTISADSGRDAGCHLLVSP